MKKIVVLRHAKSDWSKGLPDFERPLNKRGQKDAPVMGTILAAMKEVPDIIISSPAVRAKLTAKTVAKYSQYEGNIVWHEDFYYGDDESIISELKKLPDNIESAMVVGHNDTLEILIAELTSDGSFRLKFPTAAIAIISVDIGSWDELKQSSGELHNLITPKSIKKILTELE